MKYILSVILLTMLWGGLPLRAQENSQVITAQNVKSLTLEQTIGNGRILDSQWSPDGQWFGVLTSRGVWLSTQDELTSIPYLVGEEMSPVTAFAFTPDSAQLIMGHPDGLISFWEVATGTAQGTLPTGQTDILQIAISSDGTRLATADERWVGWHEQGRVILWDMATQESVTTIANEEIDSNHFSNVFFTEAGLVTNFYAVSDGFFDSEASLWDAVTGAYVIQIDVHGFNIAISPSEDAKVGFGSGVFGIPMQICTKADGCANLEEILPDAEYPHIVTFVDAHNFLVAIGNDLYTFNATRQTLNLEHHFEKFITAILYSRATDRISIGQGDIFWHYKDLQNAPEISPPFFSNALQEIILHPANEQIFTLEGTSDYSGFLNARLAVLDSVTGERAIQSEDIFVSMALNPQTSQLALSGNNGNLVLYDLANHQFQELISVSEECVLVALAFDHSGTSLAGIEIEASDGDCLAEFPIQILNLLTGELTQPGIQRYSDDLAYSPNGELFMVSTAQSLIFPDGTELELSPKQGGDIYDMTISPNGTYLVLSGAVYLLMWTQGKADSSGLWKIDLATRQQSYIQAHQYQINGNAISPDSALIATASADGTVNIYAAEDLTLLHTLPMYGGANAVQFSADGTLLYVGGEDGTIRVWGIP